MRLYRKLSFLSVLSLLFYFGCSTSKKAVDNATPPAEVKQEQPTTDKVGSIPEDSTATPADATAATADDATKKDPFADLKTTDEQAPANQTITDTAPKEANLEAATSDTPTDDKSAESAAATPAEPSKEANLTEQSDKEDKAEIAANLKTSTSTYTVQKGDTLMKIAFAIYGDIDRWHDLLEWNKEKIAKGSSIQAGLTLSYEAPMEPFSATVLDHSYLIQRGDTLGGISKGIYGRISKWRKLQEYNSKLIKDPNVIFAGFTLYYEITREELTEAASIKRSAAPASVN